MALDRTLLFVIAHINLWMSMEKTRPWSSYVWCAFYYYDYSMVLAYHKRNYRDSWNKSPEERKFLRRLDACLITYASLSYFSKYLNQQNVAVSTRMTPS